MFDWLSSGAVAWGIDADPDLPSAGYGLPQFRSARLGWHTRAACRQSSTGLFFPEAGRSAAQAKEICARCPVTEECLLDALDNGIRFGVWGGLSARERRGMYQTRRSR